MVIFLVLIFIFNFNIEQLALKEKLKCHQFSWFVERFKGVAPCWKGILYFFLIS